MRRGLVGTALLLALTFATAAVAHGPGHQPGYVSTVLAIRPAVPGLTATVLGGDQLLSVRNWSNRTVVVFDAGGRPTFRFAPNGVSRRVGPRWQLLKRGTSFTWHDARIHWPGAEPPVVVAQAPEQEHRIRAWRIRATVDGAPAVIYGSLGWVPEPTTTQLVIAADGSTGPLNAVLVLGGLIAASVLALATTRRRRRTS